MNFTGPLPVQLFFQAGYLARWANSFSSGVGVTVAAEGTDGVGVGVGVSVGIGDVEGAAQAPSKITPIARTDNNFLILV